MTAFDDVTAINRRGDTGTYDATLSGEWAIGNKPNGGYLLALLARAGCDAVGTAHPLAISGHYLRAPSAGPAEVRTEVVRSGRRVSTARATLWQGDKPYIDALVTSGELSAGPVDWEARPAPDLPPPEECAPNTPPPNIDLPLAAHTDLRVDPATTPFPTPTGEARINYWFRLTDGREPDVLSLILATDVGPPVVFNLAKYGWSPTVELTVLLRGLPAPGWLKVETRSRFVAGGWFDEESTVWDSTGRLVAQSRQLALTGTP